MRSGEFGAVGGFGRLRLALANISRNACDDLAEVFGLGSCVTSRFEPVAVPLFAAGCDLFSELEARESEGVDELMERGLDGVVDEVSFEGVIKDDLDVVALNFGIDFVGVRVDECDDLVVLDSWTGMTGALVMIFDDLAVLSEGRTEEVEEETEDRDFANDDLLVIDALG